MDQVDIDKYAVYRYAGTKNHRLHNNRHTILRYNHCALSTPTMIVTLTHTRAHTHRCYRCSHPSHTW